MSRDLPALVVHHERRPLTLDASAMGIDEGALRALPWERAFREMRELEAGAVANADEGRQVGHYWLRDPVRAPSMDVARFIGEAVEEVRTFAADVRAGRVAAPDGQKFTDVLHIGIGGSALGPLLVIDALRPSGLRVHFLDNTDPDGIAAVLAAIGDDLRHTLGIVASKSGGTPETRNGMLLFVEALKRRGFSPGGHLVAITQGGSALDQQSKKERWLRSFPIWDFVGGRTSVTSAVGLLPAELAGVDTQPFLDGARAMDEWTRAEDVLDNPAALLAGCWFVAGNGRGDRAMVALPYSDRLVLLSRYLQQLVMESLGKRLDRRGNEVFQGLTVYGNKGSTDQHAYVQQLRDGRADFFALFVQVLEDGAGSSLEVEPGVTTGDFLQGFLLGTRRALSGAGRGSMTITVPRVDAFVLGALVALFERAVGLYASLIDVNAYHQPGVEAGKAAAREILDLSRALRERLKAGPQTLSQLAEATGADRVELWSLVERLVATGRAVRLDGEPTRYAGKR